MKTLAKEHPSGVFQQVSPGNWELTGSSSTGYWEQRGASTFISETYFDLAGMSMDDKTLFFEAAGTQSVLPPAGTIAAVAGDAIIVADLMTTSPLTLAELQLAAIGGNFAPTPLSFEQTVYGRIDSWVVHVDTGTWGSYTLTNSEQIGSMMPTASDRIYSYRVLIFSAIAATETLISITPARHILKAMAKEESDHEYMMRLLRSYQLQQEPDVD